MSLIISLGASTFTFYWSARDSCHHALVWFFSARVRPVPGKKIVPLQNNHVPLQKVDVRISREKTDFGDGHQADGLQGDRQRGRHER